MAEIMAALIAFIVVGDLADKYVEPWVSDKVESFYEEGELRNNRLPRRHELQRA